MSVHRQATLPNPRFKEAAFIRSKNYRAAVTACKNELKKEDSYSFSVEQPEPEVKDDSDKNLKTVPSKLHTHKEL